MTTWDEIKNDPNARKILNSGFIALMDHMGDDQTIVQSARVSYGQGTKTVNQDRGLIRYLMRHQHTTPFEMVEFRFLCKMPIFVARQWVRHRTANVNEYSGRYSVMVDEFYVPELDQILPQSTQNHQGRAGSMLICDQQAAQQQIIDANNECYQRYQTLIGNKNHSEVYDFTDGFSGIAREMARGVLSVNNYTEWYWKCDLHNILRFLSLRMDSHAQYEIRVFAEAMYDLIKPYVPLTIEAFEDYVLHGSSVSRMELNVLKDILKTNDITDEVLTNAGLSNREISDFRNKFNI